MQRFSLYPIHKVLARMDGTTDGRTEPQQRYYISTARQCAGSKVWLRNTQRSSLYYVHKLISIYVHCDLDLWPLTSKINSFHPHIILNMSAKYDKEIHNGLVSIMFTSLFPYMSIVTLTFDLWPSKSIGIILSPCLTCLPSLMKKHTII